MTPAQVAAARSRPQKPDTCLIPPPQVHLPTGEWTATETVLTTNAIDMCAGERLTWPWSFHRRCKAGACATYLITAAYYSLEVAKLVPKGRHRYLAVFPPTPVPCPHRPGEDAGINRNYATMTLWRVRHTQILHGFRREHQVGPCGGGVATSSYVATRTNPAAHPRAEGP